MHIGKRAREHQAQEQAQEQAREQEQLRRADAARLERERAEERQNTLRWAKETTLGNLRAARSTSDEDEAYTLLNAIDQVGFDQLSPEDQQWFELRLRELTFAKADKLFKAVSENGDVNALLELDALTSTEEDEDGLSLFYENTQQHYPVPHEWNTLVAKLIKMPELDLFRISDTTPSSPELQLAIAETIHRRSLVDAKVLIAQFYADTYLEGEFTRFDELMDVIVTKHEELSLFQNDPTVGEVPPPPESTP